MNFDKLPPEIGFLFLTIGQAAVSANYRGISKEFFLEFCEEMWNTMELNGVDAFSEVLAQKLVTDIDARLGLGMHDAVQKMSKNKKSE